MTKKIKTIYYGIGENPRFRRLKPPVVSFILSNQDKTRWDVYDNSNQNIYFDIVRDIVISVCDLSQYTLILDAYPLYRYNISEFNSLAHFFQNHKCDFYFGKKHVSFTIENGQEICDFATNLRSLYFEGFFLRFLKKEKVNIEIIDALLKTPIGNNEEKYIRSAKDYRGIISIASIDCFIGFWSCYLKFENYLDIVGRIVRKYGLYFKDSSES